MTAFYSDQVTKLRAEPIQMLNTNEAGGRVRMLYFEYTVPTATVAVDDTVELCRLPTKGRILGGFFAAEAMSSAGGTAQIQIGDGTTADKYLGTTSVDAAAQADFANTVALGYGTVLNAGAKIVATAKGEAWAATKKIKGHLLYVAD